MIRLAERLRRLERARSALKGLRRVVILGPNAPSPEDDGVEVIRIVAVRPDGTAAYVLPHNEREDISALPRVALA